MTPRAPIRRAHAPQHPARPGRCAFVRALLGLLAVAVLAVVAQPAAAYWPAGPATGSGNGMAGTLDAGMQPATTISGTSVTVSWTQTAFRSGPLGAFAGGGYTILRHPAAGGLAVTPNPGCATTVSGSGASLTCTETGVPPGSWQYSVTPVLNSWTGAQSPRSTPVAVGTAAPVLASVTAQDPPAGTTTPGAIVVSWNASAGATGYDVFRRTSSGTYDYAAPLNGATPLTGTSYTDPGAGLTAGTTYAYVIRARAGSPSSASSNELSASAVARPAAPATTTATATANARVAVSWTSVAGATSGYDVFRRTGTDAYDYTAPLNGTTPVGATGYTDTTSVDGIAYRYVVRSVAPGAGTTPLQSADGPEASATADGTAPTAVSLADPGANLRGTVTLSATATGATSVRVQVAPTGTTTWADVCVDPSSPYTCNYATTALADGIYDLRALATDAAGNTTASATVAARRVDNTAPAASMTDPGAFIRGTITLSATASDGGSGLSSLVISRAPTGTTTWTVVCSQATSPAGCSLNTTTLTSGAGYDLHAVATDAAGNSTTSVVTNRVVDNTAPTGTDVQAANGTGTAGKADTGDKLTYTFSEPILPASVLSGWSGASTPVTVRFLRGAPDTVTVWNPGNTAQLPLGSITAGTSNLITTNTFSNSSMLLNGNTIVVTLGSPNATSATTATATTLSWTTAAGATDRAGNPVTVAKVTESGTADVDF